MTMTQFAMVEELAFLIKDNLPSKHLVLSVEEALVDSLMNDTSPDGVLELEPMSSYNRLLLHRLADIFGFAHESTGEGEDRRLVLERNPESSIPPMLVSDILWQQDEYQSPSVCHKLLRRKEDVSSPKTTVTSIESSLEEREAAYLAARQRIFSADDDEIRPVTPKPRNVPVVARRMIAHALGQRISSNSSSGAAIPDHKEYEERTEELNSIEQNLGDQSVSLRMSQETSPLKKKSGSYERKMQGKPIGKNASSSAPRKERDVQMKPTGNRTTSSDVSRTCSTTGKTVCRENLKQEHMGAAKRMFAHALGRNGSKEVNGLAQKCNDSKPILKDLRWMKRFRSQGSIRETNGCLNIIGLSAKTHKYGSVVGVGQGVCIGGPLSGAELAHKASAVTKEKRSQGSTRVKKFDYMDSL